MQNKYDIFNKNLAMGPIGIFDSGFGGLTVFRAIEDLMPEYDYLYLGDNARVPYGNRSHETVYEYTKECVELLFDMGCSLVVLACNTASAKALRAIQQGDLPLYPDMKKVLGVIRPTAERIGEFTTTREIGILATTGTVVSQSYPTEIGQFYPDVKVYQQACPMWVPLIESGDLSSPAAHYYTKLYISGLLSQSSAIDTVVLACTHYPLIAPLIQENLPSNIRLVGQGDIVAERLMDYLKRHPEIDELCSKNRSRAFLTTDNPRDFEQIGKQFYGKDLKANQVHVKGT